jgi:hypothetical protein
VPPLAVIVVLLLTAIVDKGAALIVSKAKVVTVAVAVFPTESITRIVAVPEVFGDVYTPEVAEIEPLPLAI